MEEKERKQVILANQINVLEAKLMATDYKVIKTFEARIKNEADPYNTTDVLNERQDIRDQINKQQAELAELNNN
ncbi:hypothetical protein [Mitsuokella sp.]|uniref:hypothetical protein n=1 Tax=Mitsuokella sp. TaxID=2049034 RepID=UPI003D7CD954